MIAPAYAGDTVGTASVSAGNGRNADIRGRWYTENREGGVEIYACGDKFCGRFYWLNDAAEGSDRDVHNPDPDKRQRKLCQLQFMGSFTPDGNGHYKDGWVYSPRNGHIYNADMTVINRDTIRLHGYVLTPLLGGSQIWKRANDMPPCDG